VVSVSGRSRSALGEPPDDLSGFPARRVIGRWFREHAARPDEPGDGCWFFTSHEPTAEPTGRFDLPTPQGTCYLAEEETTAARERCGRFLAARMPVPSGFVAGRVVSSVYPKIGKAADATHHDVPRCGVTRELFSIDDYPLTSRWARAFRAADFEALVHQPRFSTHAASACAVFGQQGIDPMRRVAGQRPLEQVLATMGVAVVPPPGSSAQPDDAVPPPD
jgi:hypothetical protein